MNTAIAITAIIAAVVVINIIVTGVRDTAQHKHQAQHCNGCTCRSGKETES